MALALGVRCRAPGDPGYDPSGPPTLVNDVDGSVVAEQFTIDIGGIAGITTIAGFHVDSLLIRTMEGDPLDAGAPQHLDFVDAPVFVQDVELMDPVTLDTFTFDGVLGTNYLFASGDLSALSGFDVPLRTGPFAQLVLDFHSPTPTLGLVVAPAVPLSPALRIVAAGALGLVSAGLLGRGRVRSTNR